MAITTNVVAAALKQAAGAARLAEAELNIADGRLGDGDTGQMLRRLFERLEDSIPDAENDIGAFFGALAKAGAGATGSSLGTLITTALLVFAKCTRGRAEVAWSELGNLLGEARDAMLSRGGAALGDKTIIDMIDAIALAVTGLDSGEAISQAARRAAVETLDTFRDRPNRIGRARMFGDKSIGIDDPGMLALARLVGVFPQPANE